MSRTKLLVTITVTFALLAIYLMSTGGLPVSRASLLAQATNTPRPTPTTLLTPTPTTPPTDTPESTPTPTDTPSPTDTPDSPQVPTDTPHPEAPEVTDTPEPPVMPSTGAGGGKYVYLPRTGIGATQITAGVGGIVIIGAIIVVRYLRKRSSSE